MMTQKIAAAAAEPKPEGFREGLQRILTEQRAKGSASARSVAKSDAVRPAGSVRTVSQAEVTSEMVRRTGGYGPQEPSILDAIRAQRSVDAA